jgi:hypothetical protein
MEGHFTNTVRQAAPGIPSRVGLELFWGGRPEVRVPGTPLRDNLQKAETSREFSGPLKAWGDVTLLPECRNAALRPHRARVGRTIPLKLEIPADAKSLP